MSALRDLFDAIEAPFSPERISWRVGSTTNDKKRGMALAYIDARDVMERLDIVVGPHNWQCRYPHATGKTVCEIGIRLTMPDGMVEWVWKADGAGDTDFEAEKGALSDAFKRAAVRWGIGRYLYDIEAKWVEIEPAGKSFKIKESEVPKLRALLGGPAIAPKRDTISSGVEKTSPEAVEFMSKVDLCASEKALDNYKATIAADVKKLNEREQELMRLRFAARRKAIRSQEQVAA